MVSATPTDRDPPLPRGEPASGGRDTQSHLISELSSSASLPLRLGGLITSGRQELSERFSRAWEVAGLVQWTQSPPSLTPGAGKVMMNSVPSARPLHLHGFALSVLPLPCALGDAAGQPRVRSSGVGVGIGVGQEAPWAAARQRRKRRQSPSGISTEAKAGQKFFADSGGGAGEGGRRGAAGSSRV